MFIIVCIDDRDNTFCRVFSKHETWREGYIESGKHVPPEGCHYEVVEEHILQDVMNNSFIVQKGG